MMSERPKNSIIIPVYNREGTLERAVESALAQTWRDFELILVDDGSTDGSLAECRRLASAHPEARVRVVEAEHGGVSSARNHGIEAARGEWVSFLDSDDELDPAFLERLMATQAETGADWVYCGRHALFVKPIEWDCYLNNFEDKTVFSGPTLSELAKNILFQAHGNILFSTCMCIYRKSILDEHGLRFPKDVPYSEDALFNYAFSFHTSCFCYLPEHLYIYHVSDDPESVRLMPDAFDKVPATIEAFERIRTQEGGEKTPEYLLAMANLILLPFQSYLHHPASSLSKGEREQGHRHFEAMVAAEPVKGVWDEITPELFRSAGDKRMAAFVKRIKGARYENAYKAARIRQAFNTIYYSKPLVTRPIKRILNGVKRRIKSLVGREAPRDAT